MSRLIIGASTHEVGTLWRYMTLDKFINLLETSELFFTPLALYMKGDPFEGLLPEVARNMTAGAINIIRKKMLCEIKKAENHFSSLPDSLLQEAKLRELIIHKEQLIENDQNMNTLYLYYMKSISVNCWHENDQESEAMWRLYNDSNEGIAIKSSVSSINNSFANSNQDYEIKIGKVKYIDYFNPLLTYGDCLVDGDIAPLLKRKSFSHEIEVRLYIHSNRELHHPHDIDEQLEFAKLPVESYIKRVKIDLNSMLEGIYISPYAKVLFQTKVKAICKQFSIDEKMVHNSGLLDGFEDLLNLLKESDYD
jgi:hypothetical protein